MIDIHKYPYVPLPYLQLLSPSSEQILQDHPLYQCQGVPGQLYDPPLGVELVYFRYANVIFIVIIGKGVLLLSQFLAFVLCFSLASFRTYLVLLNSLIILLIS